MDTSHLIAIFGGMVLMGTVFYFFCFVDWDKRDSQQEENSQDALDAQEGG